MVVHVWIHSFFLSSPHFRYMLLYHFYVFLDWFFTEILILPAFVFSALILSFLVSPFYIIVPFNISYKAGLVVISSFNFVCLGNSLSPLPFRMIAFLDRVFWLQNFPIQHFEYIMPPSSGLPSLWWKISCYPLGFPL